MTFFQSFGKTLGATVVLLSICWIVVLIVAPVTFLIKESFVLPRHQSDKTVVNTLIGDANTCILILNTFGEDKPSYVMQCERTNTSVIPPRYGVPQLFVDAAASVEEQKAQAQEIISAVEGIEVQEPRRYGVDNYFTMKPITFKILVTTLLSGVMVTALSLVICYPIAYNMAFGARSRARLWLFVALITPYSLVELMRIYAWASILEDYKQYSIAVFLVLVYVYMLFMLFPIYNAMTSLHRNQIRAAQSLGAGWVTVHRRVILPHCKSGIAVASVMVFMLSASAFSVPRIVSRGLQGEWFSQTIYTKYFETSTGSIGAAYAVIFTLVAFVMIVAFMRRMKVKANDFTGI
jgi:ABC-type spermidine/putrescine transport system permease subunit I